MIRATSVKTERTHEAVSPFVIMVSDGDTSCTVPYPPGEADHKAAFRQALRVAGDDHAGYGTDARFVLQQLLAGPAGGWPVYEEVAHLDHGQAIDVVAGLIDPLAMTVPVGGPTATVGGCPVPGCSVPAGGCCADPQCCGEPRVIVFEPAQTADILSALHGVGG